MSIKALREFSATPPQPKVAARLRGMEVSHPATDKGDLPGHADSGGLGAAQMLVPVDFSDRSLRALNFAGGLARQFGASIGLLHVVAPSRFPGRLLRRRRDVAQRQREALARIQEWQAVAVSRCRRAGAAVALGRPAAEIVAAAERLSADLIVLASGGRKLAPEVPARWHGGGCR